MHKTKQHGGKTCISSQPPGGEINWNRWEWVWQADRLRLNERWQRECHNKPNKENRPESKLKRRTELKKSNPRSDKVIARIPKYTKLKKNQSRHTYIFSVFFLAILLCSVCFHILLLSLVISCSFPLSVLTPASPTHTCILFH